VFVEQFLLRYLSLAIEAGWAVAFIKNMKEESPNTEGQRAG